MSCCAIGPCGRMALDTLEPGTELWNGKYSCTLCYVNPTRYKQPVFKKHMSEQQSQNIASAPVVKTNDLLGEK